MPTFPSIDLTRFELPKIDLGRISPPTVDLTKLPSFRVPRVEVRPVDLPVDTDRMVGLARDAAYVGIGFGVLAVQRAQVNRRELQATVERGVRTIADAVSGAATTAAD